MAHTEYAVRPAGRSPGRIAAAAVVLAVAGIVAGVLGSALAPTTVHAPPAPPPILGSGAVQLPFDDTWERTAPPRRLAIPGVQILGALETPGSPPSVILGRVDGRGAAQAVPAALGAHGRPQRVKLADGVGQRYAVTVPGPSGGAGSALLETVGGTTAVVLCLAGDTPDQQSTCEALSTALRVRDATPTDPDPAYAGALAVAVRELNTSIPAATRRLAGAHRPDDVAAAATALSKRWSDMADRLRALPPTRGSQAPTARLIAGASAVAAQTRALAAAARRHVRRGVARAAAAAQASERAFAAGLGALGALGYRVR